MNKSEISKISSEFVSCRKFYEELASRAATVLGDILRETDVRIHSISSRCKAVKDLEGKLAKPEKGYKTLTDITDLAGVRITTYFASDVDEIAEVVRENFDVDEQHSVDKRELVDPERFGYRSLHFVCSFPKERTALADYRHLKGLVVEIQIRSILQHAWAEIEHDLGYKSAAGVPKKIRRRFSRVAGLLELADDEFAAIREELLFYSLKVMEEIAKGSERVSIDNVSMSAIMTGEHSWIRRLSENIAKELKANIDGELRGDVVDRCVRMLNFVGVATIAELEKTAELMFARVLAFAPIWVPGVDRGNITMSSAVGVLYLCYVLVMDRQDRNFSLEFARAANLQDENSIADRLEAARQELGR